MKYVTERRLDKVKQAFSSVSLVKWAMWISLFGHRNQVESDNNATEHGFVVEQLRVQWILEHYVVLFDDHRQSKLHIFEQYIASQADLWICFRFLYVFVLSIAWSEVHMDTTGVWSKKMLRQLLGLGNQKLDSHLIM